MQVGSVYQVTLTDSSSQVCVWLQVNQTGGAAGALLWSRPAEASRVFVMRSVVLKYLTPV